MSFHSDARACADKHSVQFSRVVYGWRLAAVIMLLLAAGCTPRKAATQMTGNWTLVYDWSCKNSVEAIGALDCAFKADGEYACHGYALSGYPFNRTIGKWKFHQPDLIMVFDSGTYYSGTFRNGSFTGAMVSTKNEVGCWTMERKEADDGQQ